KTAILLTSRLCFISKLNEDHYKPTHKIENSVFLKRISNLLSEVQEPKKSCSEYNREKNSCARFVRSVLCENIYLCARKKIFCPQDRCTCSHLKHLFPFFFLFGSIPGCGYPLAISFSFAAKNVQSK
ncbi:hypothetical protein CEXT_630731, partial [Caerostris extrusa]